MSRLDRVPLKPDYAAVAGRRTGTPLVRAAAASVEAYITKGLAEDVVAYRWPRDGDTELILRAAVAPATLTTSGWADSLAATSVADFIANMGPASAGSQLLQRGLQLQFHGAAAISVPGLLSAAGNTSFVQEGAPVPVRQFSIADVLLEPRKFMTITAFAREVFEHSTPTIETLVRAVLTESVGLALDSALFDDVVADEKRPAGLRAGIAALGAPSTDPDRISAMLEDLQSLTTAVAPVAGNAPIIFICAPAQTIAIRLWGRNEFAYEVLSSNSLADGTVIAIASNAIASATDAVPEFRVGMHGVLVLQDDAVPAQLGENGVVGSPAKSLWQSDLIALWMRLKIAWALRNTGGLAWLESVSW